MYYPRPAPPLSVIAVAGWLLAACASAPTPEAATRHPAAGQFTCGRLAIEVNPVPDSRLIGIDYRASRLLLKPVPSPAGQLYRAPGDHRTQFHYRDERAELTLRGERLPPCLRPGALVLPFQAQGTEPPWRAVIEDGYMIVSRPYSPNDALSLALESVTANRHGQTFQARLDGAALTLSVAAQLCEAQASGEQFPYQAHLVIDGEAFMGCGGDPQRLFEGAHWRVRQFADDSLAKRSPVTIQFLEAGRVAGRSPCNGFQGRYRLSGGELVFDQLSTGGRACSSALMAKEDRFLGLMRQVTRARIGRNGELLLSTAEGESILAVPSANRD